MPQMMPMKWLSYYFLFMIILMMMMSMIHFMKNNKFNKKYIKPNMKNWYWK
uniref:ATP synthase F0 subunit 8 n=1 Tax=Ammophila sabulosa TaxID=1088610 RepID=A0A7L7S1M8_9HYME|nr:ATP synthase F0 subunit 8 [Ammophila sabulosa]